ncbi:MAG: SOS response-associated peptidase [Chloroflexota bacterium]|nr:MAG: SOS response-associated peptidase [Chloroflexota bacterium]
MCGRFTLTADPAKLQEAFPWVEIPEGVRPRYNIAPSQPVAVIANTGENKLDFFVWGLIPSWAKDPTIGNRLINARAETLAEKPSYRTAYRRKRCLVLADGFYEWKQDPIGKSKTPMYVRMETGEPFAFAGLWDQWNSPDGSMILSCTIITTEPNSLMESIHNRMPVILTREAYAQWLDPAEQRPEDLNKFLRPYPAEALHAYPVSRIVNSPDNEVPDCIVPVTA